VSRITKTVSIKTDPKSVMNYVADVRNHPAFIGPLKAVTNLSGPSSTSGAKWDWTFIMAGIELTGRAELVEYVEGKRYKYKTTSGALSTFDYSVEQDGANTRLTMDVEYEVPASVLGKLQAVVVEKLNDKAAEQATESIKVILED